MKKGIRYQLVPRSINKLRSTRETKVIVVAEESYQLSPEILSSILHVTTWEEKYSLSQKQYPGLKDQYLQLLKILLSQINIEDGISLKSKIIKHSREVMGGGSEQLSSRYVRRRMIGRLTSLLIDFDPLKEIFKDEQVLGVTISGQSYFRVHNGNGSITNKSWFVGEEESKLLKLVLCSYLNKGNADIVFSDSLVANVSSLRKNESRDGSIIISPKRSRKKSMLDLIRAKVLSPQLAKNISKSMLNSGKGFLISGGLNSGKSGLLSALISSVSSDSIPLIIADNEELKSCHPHAEVLSHAEISEMLSNSTYRFLEDSIFRIGAKYLFVDDLNPNLYLFLLRMRLVYDISIVASIPSINPKHYLKYLLEDVRSVKNLNSDIDEIEVANLVDAFPYIISLSMENDKKGISYIFETSAAGKTFHLVPVVRREFENEIISWKTTEVASPDSLITKGFDI